MVNRSILYVNFLSFPVYISSGFTKLFYYLISSVVYEMNFHIPSVTVTAFDIHIIEFAYLSLNKYSASF